VKNKNSREEIRAIYAQAEDAVIALVESLLERTEQLAVRVEGLEHQQSKTSRNRSKPPSGGEFGKRSRSLRGKRERSRGGQSEHPGTVQYGAGIKGMMVYLMEAQLLPSGRSFGEFVYGQSRVPGARS